MEDNEREAAKRQLLETPAAELAARRAQIQAHALAAGFSAEEIQELLNSRADLPRALLPEERDALLLSFESLDEPTRAPLRTQVAAAKVSRYDCPCPCATVGLVVDKTKAPPARVRETPFGDVSIYDPDGEVIGGVMVSIQGGYLSGIEIWWIDEPISPIPPRQQLVVEPPTNAPSRGARAIRCARSWLTARWRK
jgi:hypothetical protein